MTRIQRLMKLHRLMAPQGGEGGEGGGGSGGGDDAAAAAAAAEAAAAQAEADRIAAEAAAAEAAKPKPSDAEAKLLKEVMDKKTALATANTELAQVKERLAAFDGIDVVAVRALLKERQDAEEAQAIAAGDFERLKKKMADSHATEKTELLGKIEAANTATQTLQQQIAELTVGGAFASSEYVKDELVMPVRKARALYGAHFEFKDGQVVGYDKPAGAPERTLFVDAAGTALSFEDAMKKIIDADPDRDTLVRSKVRPGAGSGTQKKPGKDVPARDENLTATEKIARGLKNLAKQNGGK